MSDRILIVKLSSMGDVIHTLPAARAIRDAYPEAVIGWAVERRHAEIIRDQPILDRVIEWDRRNRRTLWDFIRRLRRGRWDVAIDFQGLLRSAMVTRLSGARRRIGYRPAKELAHWWYTERVPLATMERHAVERYLDLAAALPGVVVPEPLERPYLDGREPLAGRPRGDRFPLVPTAADRREVDDFLHERGFDPSSQSLVVIAPECRREANIYPAVKFIELARRLLSHADIRIALCGGPSSAPLYEEIAEGLDGRIWRAEGRFGLTGSAALLKQAQVAVTGDTGVLHMAVAAGTRVVALFGPSSPLRTGPYCDRAILLHHRLDCSPCFGRSCPLGYDPPSCMDSISVDELYNAVMRQLTAAAEDRHRLPQRKSA